MANLADTGQQDPFNDTILGIESSCDETAAAVLIGGTLGSNVIAGQSVHAAWGGVVPELASRAHQEHIVPVVDQALKEAGVKPEDLDAIAFTQGPGLIGALLVGACFARSMGQALGIPIIAVDHVRSHALAHFIDDGVDRARPEFPFLALTVSGGHSLLVDVRSPMDLRAIGSTLDDAAGEVFDKGAKILGLPYPGGPLIDKLATHGDAKRYELPVIRMPGLDMSFSGTKSAFRQVVVKVSSLGEAHLRAELPHLAASLQHSLIEQLLRKTTDAMDQLGYTQLGIAGGVSANSGLRERMREQAARRGWDLFIPPAEFCTDNAAMIAVAGAFMHRAGIHAGLDTVPLARIAQG